MKKIALLLLAPFLIVACSLTGGEAGEARSSAEAASLAGHSLELEDCRLLARGSAKESLLYHFEGEHECGFMRGDDGSPLAVSTSSGEALVIELPGMEDGVCRTKAIALVEKQGALALSTRYYARYQCKGHRWHEKSFHVLAAETFELPAAPREIREIH